MASNGVSLEMDLLVHAIILRHGVKIGQSLAAMTSAQFSQQRHNRIHTLVSQDMVVWRLGLVVCSLVQLVNHM